MILVKKTAVLSQRGVHGICGVARFECFKDKSDVKINLTGKKKDLYAVVAVGDEKKVVKLSGDRIYLTRADLSGDCAALIADSECRVLCAGATTTGYDFEALEKFLPAAIGADSIKTVHEGSGNHMEIKQKDDTVLSVNVDKGAARQKLSGSVEERMNSEVWDGMSEPAGQQDSTEEKQYEEVVSGSEKQEKGVGIKDKISDDVKNSDVSATSDAPFDDIKNSAEISKSFDENKERFFDRIEDKIEKLFRENESDAQLNALIPDSRWARVRTEDGWYVVGIVGEPAEFICYGIPADNPSDPPEEDAGCRQWMEVEKGGRGYWMMYQSAENGETLTAV